MQLSYAQNLEDYHLSLAFADQSDGFYIDVGGGHPVADNVSFHFYLAGWRGIVVEPQDRLHALYRHARPRDLAMCGLVGREVGEAAFHAVDTLHGLSSMVEDHARQASAYGVGYATLRKPLTTLTTLCEAHRVERIDFLKIDVEGAEGDVLAGMDWRRFHPRIVVAEAVAPHSMADASRDWEPILTGNGYRFRLFDGVNRFYVAQEEPDLFARLPERPADWGAVRHLYEFGRAPENPDHPDHGLAKKLATSLWAALPTLEPSLLASLAGVPEEEVRTDRFRAALGRIAATYDGGLMLEDLPPVDQGPGS
jgi:FkbM family methyltransferase